MQKQCQKICIKNHICENIYGKNTDTNGKSIIDSSTWGNHLDNNTIYNQEITGLWAKHKWKPSEWVLAEKYSTSPVNEYPTFSSWGKEGVIIELPTGASENFKNYNIYDMAGNMFEWRTEHNYIKEDEKPMYIVKSGRQLCVERK